MEDLDSMKRDHMIKRAIQSGLLNQQTTIKSLSDGEPANPRLEVEVDTQFGYNSDNDDSDDNVGADSTQFPEVRKAGHESWASGRSVSLKATKMRASVGNMNIDSSGEFLKEPPLSPTGGTRSSTSNIIGRSSTSSEMSRTSCTRTQIFLYIK